MCKLIIVVIILFTLMLLMYLNSKSREHFDIYWNHDKGVAQMYNMNVKDTALLYKYKWGERDSNGLTVYDKYYEILNGYNYEPGYRGFGKDSLEYMIDKHPFQEIINGQTITLSQKKY